MKYRTIIVRPVVSLAFFIILSSGILARDVITLQTGWKFARGNFDRASQINFDDSKWQNVTIRHDWAIEGPVLADGDGNTGKLPWSGEGWYRKKLEIPANWQGKQVYLLFDGVMAFPEIFINGKPAGKWDYGYNSFYLNVTGFLRPGKENFFRRMLIPVITGAAGIRGQASTGKSA